MGLAALGQKLVGCNAAVMDDIDCLLVLTKVEFGQLHQLFWDLRDGGKCAEGLLPCPQVCYKIC
jgi:hypothetical protein